MDWIESQSLEKNRTKTINKCKMNMLIIYCMFVQTLKERMQLFPDVSYTQRQAMCCFRSITSSAKHTNILKNFTFSFQVSSISGNNLL